MMRRGRLAERDQGARLLTAMAIVAILTTFRRGRAGGNRTDVLAKMACMEPTCTT
jgi:hypothetical protein